VRVSSNRATRTRFIMQRWQVSDLIVILASGLILVASFSGVLSK
jgi:hypothetical protein